MSIKPIIAVLSIAGTSFALTGCSGEGKTSFDTAMAALNGGTSLLGSAPAPARVVAAVESVAEPEPPAPEPLPPAKVWTCYPFRGTTFCDWL